MLRHPLTRADIEGVFAGLRPLVAAGQGADTTKLSREHTVSSAAPGLTAIAGGKYTTYRVMARDLIDAAAAGLPAARSPPVAHGHGAAGGRGWVRRAEAAGERIAADSGLPAGRSTGCSAGTGRASMTCSA